MTPPGDDMRGNMLISSRGRILYTGTYERMSRHIGCAVDTVMNISEGLTLKEIRDVSVRLG